MCCSELQNVWISINARVICSYILQEFNKYSYQSNPRLKSLSHVTIVMNFSAPFKQEISWHSEQILDSFKKQGPQQEVRQSA
jgi:hypothetical protein